MIKKIIKTIYVLVVFLFIYFVFKIYFSENNIKEINKNRLNIEENLKKSLSNLPVLENDTKDIIEYNSNFDIKKSIKKKRNFWKLLSINE